MWTFIILCITAIAVEAIRRFIVEKYGKIPLSGIQILPGLIVIGTIIGSWYLFQWAGTGILVVAIVIDLVLILAQTSGDKKGLFQKDIDLLHPEEKKQIAAYFSSFLIPLIAIVVIANIADRQFDAKWGKTAPLTVKCQPLKTIVNGNETVVLECTELPNDLSFGVNKYGFDVLKLEEGDKVKYLKINGKDRLEIETLQGQPYKKK